MHLSGISYGAKERVIYEVVYVNIDLESRTRGMTRFVPSVLNYVVEGRNSTISSEKHATTSHDVCPTQIKRT